MKKRFPFFILTAFFLFSCTADKEEQKKREQDIADSVSILLTGKPLSDSTNIKRLEKNKLGSPEVSGIKKADPKSLKNIKVEFDYDNKPFNKKSDIDGKIYNNSKTATYKNIELKAICKDKNGAVTKSFVQTIHITIFPNSSHKFTLRFEDKTTTRSASVVLLAAEEI